MDLQLLKTFLEVYRTRHFGQAAEALFLTQSAVSARIRLLEQHIGMPLFERRRDGLELTSAGWRFLPQAERLLRDWQQTLLVTRGQAETQGWWRIGAWANIWQAGLSTRLFERAQTHGPGLWLEEGQSSSLLRRVATGELDMALLCNAPRLPDLESWTVAHIELQLVGERDYRADEYAAAFISVDWGETVAYECLQLGLIPGRVRLSSARLALEYLQQFGGLALLPLALAQDVRAVGLQPQTFTPLRCPVYGVCTYGQRARWQELIA